MITERRLDDALATGHMADRPADMYAMLHAGAAHVVFSEFWNAPVLFRYADVMEALRTHDRFSSRGRVVNHLRKAFPVEADGSLRPLADHYSAGLINSDPPDHTRLRRIIRTAFTSSALDRLRPEVTAICDELLDAAAQMGTVDFVRTVAFQLPVTVIATLMGIPVDMRLQFKAWSVGIAEFMSTPNPTLEVMRRSQHALLELRAYFATVFEARRKAPGEDLISLLVLAQDDGTMLTEEELQSTCVTLLIGGHETTTSLLASAAWHIGRAPDVRRALIDQPDLISGAVEEFLRYESPFQRILRVVATPTEFAGEVLAEGDTVVLLLGAANRDPAVFPDPDRLDLRRSPNKHVAFGYGIHHCLGAALARLEAPILLGALLNRFPDYACLTMEPEWHDGMVRSIRKLDVALR